MKDLLDKGRVPSAPIIDILKGYVEKSEGDGRYILQGLEEATGIPFDTLETWLYHPERTSSLSFQTADDLLCGMGMYWLWYSDLSHIYQNVDLHWKKCERDGCETWFKLSDRANHHYGKRRRRFCSHTCGQMQHLLEKGKIKSARKYNSKTHCRNGHRRLDVGVNAEGCCLGCIRDSHAKTRVKLAEKRRAYQREWYQRNREAKQQYQREWRERRREAQAA